MRKSEAIDSTRGRNLRLDSLRAWAMLAVMIYHYPEDEHASLFGVFKFAGFFGVELFFVLSGFLIASQYFARKRAQSWRRFYLRRAFRTLPAFYVMLALYALFPALREHPREIPLAQLLTFTANYGLTFSTFSHVWTLCVEEQFYFIFPLLVALLRKWMSLRIALSMGFAFALLGVIARASLWTYQIEPLRNSPVEFYDAYFSSIYYPTWSHIDGLIWGVMIAGVRHYRPDAWVRFERWSGATLAFGALCFIVSLILMLDRFSGLTTSVIFTINALGASALTAFAVARPGSRQPRPVTTGLALVSYSVYLVHRPVFHFLSPMLAERGPWFALLGCMVAALVAGLTLYAAVERPFLKLRDRLV